MGLRGQASIMMRSSFKRGDPIRIELGEHLSWAIRNPEVAAPLELRQIDAQGGTVWLAARHLPGRAFNLYLTVTREVEVEELGVVIVCEE